eukprot:COSAG02_NODE_3957_length_5984_cov_19.884112_4_plen_90_part_00
MEGPKGPGPDLKRMPPLPALAGPYGSPLTPGIRPYARCQLRELALGKGKVSDSFWQLVTTDNGVWQSKTDASRYMRAAFNVGYDADLGH